LNNFGVYPGSSMNPPSSDGGIGPVKKSRNVRGIRIEKDRKIKRMKKNEKE
tara:strand:- start:789 stop:941 length:153 start_codon:yes stop_codon:yes gene_type:complete